ncbi:sugar ABC transporter permease [Tessaracoccus terricola]
MRQESAATQALATKLESGGPRAPRTGPGRLWDNWVHWANRHRKWVLSAPAVAFIVAMVSFPIAYTIYLSVTNAQGSVTRDVSFIGLENYVTLLTASDRFWPAVWRTIYFTVGAVAIELVLGMAIALLLRRPFRGERWVRVVILLPLVATPVAVGMMWMLIFQPQIGAANEILRTLGLPIQPWLSSSTQALPTLMFVDIWQWTPMVALILLAGLTVIPEEPDEAARVDGASSFQRFWYVTLPLLMPTLVTAVLLRSIDALKTFDILYATKGRGGGSFHEAETLNVLAYSLSFDYNRYGQASAVLILFFFFIVIVVAGLVLTRRKGRL